MEFKMELLMENWRKFLKEEQLDELKCWPGYERVKGSTPGAPGSCREKTNEEVTPEEEEDIEELIPQLKGASKMHKGQAKKLEKAIDEQQEVEEGKICDKGISYVVRTDPGGKDIKKGKDGKLKNWSARAAQIASKYCKDPDYGKGRGKDAKDESIQEAEGGLKAWEKENWTHSDGSPCGDPKGGGDGSDSRCKPASKWKTMTKGEKAADNRKKKAGTKAGKQHVKSSHPVTKAHTKRNESLQEDTRDTYGSEVVDRNKKTFDNALVEKSAPKKIKLKVTRGLDEKKKKPCKKAKGKKYVKRVNGRCRSFGQSGQAKGGGPRIRPGTKKGDAYCARSAKIKKCKNPPCANALSRKKWKCRGSKSMKENEKALSEGNWWEKPPAKPKKDPFARPRRKEEPKKDPFSRPRSGAGEWWTKDKQEAQPGEVGGVVPPDGHIYYAWPTDDLDLDMKIKKIRPDGKYEVWTYHGF